MGDDKLVRLFDHGDDPRAGEVEYELHALVTRTADGRLQTQIAFSEGIKDQRDAASHLRTVVANMEDRPADATFTLVVARDDDPEDPGFPFAWEAEWYTTHVADGGDAELCGNDPAARARVLRRAADFYEAKARELAAETAEC